MPKIIWNPAYSVGVQELDSQHKHLVDFMNEIYDKLDRDVLTDEDLNGFFGRLSKHARTHFETEENDFALCNYPEAAAHIAQHRMIEEQIAELQKKFETDKLTKLVYDTLQLIGHWLFVHITEYDKKYTRCFNEHGLF